MNTQGRRYMWQPGDGPKVAPNDCICKRFVHAKLRSQWKRLRRGARPCAQAEMMKRDKVLALLRDYLPEEF
jgi:hypothetical protein